MTPEVEIVGRNVVGTQHTHTATERICIHRELSWLSSESEYDDEEEEDGVAAAARPARARGRKRGTAKRRKIAAPLPKMSEILPLTRHMVMTEKPGEAGEQTTIRGWRCTYWKPDGTGCMYVSWIIKDVGSWRRSLVSHAKYCDLAPVMNTYTGAMLEAGALPADDPCYIPGGVQVEKPPNHARWADVKFNHLAHVQSPVTFALRSAAGLRAFRVVFSLGLFMHMSGWTSAVGSAVSYTCRSCSAFTTTSKREACLHAFAVCGTGAVKKIPESSGPRLCPEARWCVNDACKAYADGRPRGGGTSRVETLFFHITLYHVVIPEACSGGKDRTPTCPFCSVQLGPYKNRGVRSTQCMKHIWQTCRG